MNFSLVAAVEMIRQFLQIRIYLSRLFFLKSYKVEMKPLVTNQRILKWIGAYPFDVNTSKRSEIGYMIFGFIMFALNLCGVAASVCFILKVATINLYAALHASYQVISFSNLMYLMVFAFVQRYRVATAIEKLSEIYDQRKQIFLILN